MYFGFSKKEVENERTVVFWTLQLAAFDGFINGVITEFEKENPGAKIKWVDVPYSEGEKRTLAAVMSDNPPDLVNLNPDFSFLLAQKGALAFFSEKDISQFNQGLMSALRYDGKCFALPFYATSAVTFYNKALLQKAGISKVPKTYDELYALAEPLKNDYGVFVTMPALSENDTMLKILNKYGINSPQKLDTKAAYELFRLYKALYERNLIPKESLTQTHREVLEKYMSGELVFLQAGANFLNLIKENAPQVYKNTGIARQMVGTTGRYDFSLMNLIIPERAKNKELALKFALYLTNEKNQLEFSKLTNVLPVEKNALKNEYYTSCGEDLISQSRCVSAAQLNSVQKPILYAQNQKEVITLVNTQTQEIVMGKNSIEKALKDTASKWERLISTR